MKKPNYIQELQEEIISLISMKYGDLGLDINKDVKVFLDQSKEKLIRWTLLLENKQISKDEFALLIYSQKDLFVMDVLYKSGISKIALSHLKNTIIALVIKKAAEVL